MKRALAAILFVSAATVAARAQTASVSLPITPVAVAAKPLPAKPATTGTAAPTAAPADPASTDPSVTGGLPKAPQGPMTLMLRGLDKISGRPTEIAAPVGKPVRFATLTITARYCYSTPASETPETAAFVQIQDHRPDQNERRIFSGWMYASTPGLNAVEHPLYDVWVITCKGGNGAMPATVAAGAPAKVLSPDSSDKEGIVALPEEAGQ